MANLRLLDVAIGILLMLLLISLLVTIVQEGLASLLKLRAGNLCKAVVNLLGKARATELYKHPLIASLYRPKVEGGSLDANKRSLPSYIPSATFVVALLDVFQREQAGQTPGTVLATSAGQLLARAREIIERVEDATLKRALSLLIPDAPAPGAPAPDATALNHSVAAPLERWFDQAMDRAGGWYKRQAQALSIAIGFVVAVAANADVLHVASRLWNDASLRASVTAAAEAYHAEHAADAKGGPAAAAADDSLGKRLDGNLTALEESTLPIGWREGTVGTPPETCVAQMCYTRSLPSAILMMIAGWLVTALATSLGAPFWFDMLNRALQMRSSGGRVAAANDHPKKR